MYTLIVEDDSASRRLLERFLAPYGDSAQAPDGSAALALFQKSLEEGPAFDLICLDLMLPDVDGQIILERMRQREDSLGIPPEDYVPVFITSGLEKPAYEEDSELRKRKISYLTKPIERKKLRELLESYDLITD